MISSEFSSLLQQIDYLIEVLQDYSERINVVINDTIYNAYCSTRLLKENVFSIQGFLLVFLILDLTSLNTMSF